MSIFGINLASRALQAHQRALEVTGQNIANVDTPGYSRQVAITRPVPGPAVLRDLAGSPVAPGGGVDVVLVQRTHAAWLDGSAARLTGQLGRAAIDDRTARQLENLLAEPTEAGVQATIGRFLSAFGQLANRPEDRGMRDGVVRAGREVATRFRQLTDGLHSIRQDLLADTGDNIAAINEITKEIANLSRAIGQTQAAGAQPNELLDQRDQLLQELTRRAGATYSGQTTGDLVVSLGGVTLVQGGHAEQLTLDPATMAVTLSNSGTAVTPTGGELHAQQEWSNTLLPQYQTRIAAFRDQLATAINSLHQSGRDATGAAGLPFFVSDAGGNLEVNPDVAGDSQRVVAGDGAAGDGRVAQAIADLGSAGGTLLPPYQSLTAEIGARAADNRRVHELTSVSLQQVQSVQAAESGVNLDEELAHMVSLQHAYAASARLLSAYDEMLSTLIQVGGG